MVNDIIDTYTVQAGNGDEGNVSLLVLVGQKEHLHGNNCIVDTDGSLSKGTEVNYHEVSFELQANSHNWSIKGKTRMTIDKAGNIEWEEILHRINMLVLYSSNLELAPRNR